MHVFVCTRLSPCARVHGLLCMCEGSTSLSTQRSLSSTMMPSHIQSSKKKDIERWRVIKAASNSCDLNRLHPALHVHSISSLHVKWMKFSAGMSVKLCLHYSAEISLCCCPSTVPGRFLVDAIFGRHAKFGTTPGSDFFCVSASQHHSDLVLKIHIEHRSCSVQPN